MNKEILLMLLEHFKGTMSTLRELNNAFEYEGFYTKDIKKCITGKLLYKNNSGEQITVKLNVLFDDTELDDEIEVIDMY